MIKNGKFVDNSLFTEFAVASSVLKCYNHAARYKKHYKLKNSSFAEKVSVRRRLKIFTKIEDPAGKTKAAEHWNRRSFHKIRTIKPYCPFSGMIRGVIPHLKISKFKAREFARQGLIFGMKKA